MQGRHHACTRRTGGPTARSGNQADPVGKRPEPLQRFRLHQGPRDVQGDVKAIDLQDQEGEGRERLGLLEIAVPEAEHGHIGVLRARALKPDFAAVD
jgi:hypothetical protein